MPELGSPGASPAAPIQETAAKLVVSEVRSVYAEPHQSQVVTTAQVVSPSEAHRLNTRAARDGFSGYTPVRSTCSISCSGSGVPG